MKSAACRVLVLLLWAGTRAEAQKTQRRPPARPLAPLVRADENEALAHAARWNLPALVAVGMSAEGEVPAAFLDPGLARASRMIVALANVDYASEKEFFKSRRIAPDRVPCFLLLDGHGNVLEVRPAEIEPALLVAAVRNARTLMKSIARELPKVLARAEDLAAGDEKEFLTLVRPWLERHYRGYPEAARLRELAVARGIARLAKLQRDDLDGLRAIARDYAHSPVEARAFLEIARRHESRGERDDSKRTLRFVLDELPWPENAEVHAEARAILARFRREEIRRREEAMEKSRGGK
ncbi:MAG: hypothetical protein HYY17_12730 [Planctomycetes bacterium]|nr:hypothetical protein [Planctomycetota bacterium]